MITYKKLFHLLVDRNIKKGEFAAMAQLPPNTMQRLTNDKGINTETLNKICIALNCQPGDILEFVPVDKDLEILEQCHKIQNKLKGISDGDDTNRTTVKSQVKYKLKM